LARVEKTAQQEAVMGARAEQMNATVAEFLRTLAEFGRVETSLKEQRAAIAAVLAEAPAAVRQVGAAREELDGRVAEIPALVEAQAAQITRVAGEAEVRLGATVETLNKRLAEAEALIGDVVAKLERVAALPEPATTVVAAPVAVVPEVAPAPVAQPVVEKPKVVVSSEAIMDPFLIPDDGYASLAEAMDARNA
jgi:ABC-type transporter Mla subunit MlaD